MKVRRCFVSNSSSSSFIISDEHFSSVRELATYMIKQQIEENLYDDYEFNNESILYKEKLISKLNNIDENDPVSFPSCNYDTYIKKFGDCYLVSTCNNTDWNLYEFTTRLTEKAKNEMNEIAIKSSNKIKKRLQDVIDEPYEFYHIGKDYYDLRHEILGVETYDYCPNQDKIEHKENYHMWKTVKHGKICLVCNQVWKRKEKLEQINKNQE